MKLSSTKFLLIFTAICVFSLVSFAQVSQMESVNIPDRKLNITELPDPKFKEYRHIQGVLSVRVTFQADGKIGEVSLISNSFESQVTDEIIEATKRIKFEPEIKNGKPVNLTKTLQYIFSWEYWGWKNIDNKIVEETKTSQTEPVNVLDRKLKIIDRPIPKFTEEQKEMNICVQGTVAIRIEFLGSGEIGKVVAINSLPYGLTENAIEAAKKIKFEPETKDGMTITVFKSVQYSFSWDGGWRNTPNKYIESLEKGEKEKSPQPEN